MLFFQQNNVVNTFKLQPGLMSYGSFLSAESHRISQCQFFISVALLHVTIIDRAILYRMSNHNYYLRTPAAYCIQVTIKVTYQSKQRDQTGTKHGVMKDIVKKTRMIAQNWTYTWPLNY